jgi:hypothetical protein
MNGLQYFRWDGARRELGECWRLRKGEREARCIITTHPSHWWELRLTIGDELIQSQAFNDHDKLLETVAGRRARLIKAGWSEPPGGFERAGMKAKGGA